MARHGRILGAAVVALGLGACASEDGPQLELQPTDESLTLPQSCDVPPPPSGVRTVQVVFSCDEVAVGTWRALPQAADDTLAFALQALLQGPTAEERASGLSSFFSDATAGMLNHAVIRDGVAHVDFRNFAELIPNASSSAGSTQLLDQIAGTVFQFDGVREAELTFDGSCDAFWNWLQRGCQRLTRDTAEE